MITRRGKEDDKAKFGVNKITQVHILFTLTLTKIITDVLQVIGK